MKNKPLKTKDRKKLIRTLRTQLGFRIKLSYKYLNEKQSYETENAMMRRFIRCYGNYVMRNGNEKDKREFKRLMKLNCGDVKWL